METSKGSRQSQGLQLKLFARSQFLLLASRKRNGLVYTLATIAGIFCVPGGLSHLSGMDPLVLAQKAIPLPLMTLLMSIGLYVYNDLTDVEIDRANGKKRPIAMGLVTRKQTIAFVISTNAIAVLLGIATSNLETLVLIGPMIALGLLYSAPKVALKDRFLVKTLTIAFLMSLCVLLGTTAGSDLLANPTIALFGGLMVAMMIFVTSPYNDMGDVKGDSAAGRRTIPIVLGKKKTLLMIAAVALSMSAISWILYLSSEIGVAGSLIISAITGFVLYTLLHSQRASQRSLRKQHSRLVPLHLLLHLAIILGAVIVA